MVGVSEGNIGDVVKEIAKMNFSGNGKTPDKRSVARVMSIIYRSPDPEVYRLCDSYTDYATA